MGKIITLAQQKGGSGKTTVAANLAVALALRGMKVAVVDSDPQGSLGRWFMARRARGEPGMEFSTASAWGVSYECDKLRRVMDVVIVDTPPKVDADLRPALREADLVLVPVSGSMMDLWAVDGVMELIARENRPSLIVLNRVKGGARLSERIAREAMALGQVATAQLASRVAYAESLGEGRAAVELRGPAAAEVQALTDEVLAALA
jgi:chromosome partitioning protein